MVRDPGLFNAHSLSHNLAGIKFHQHCGVAFEFLDGNGQPKVVEDEKLELEVVKFGKRQTTNLERLV